MTDFEVVVNAVVTCRGMVLLGQKEEVEGHPISGQWHFIGGHLDEGEEPEEAVKREVKEETGLDVDVHHLVDTTTLTWSEDDRDFLRIFFHCEADEPAGEPMDDLQDLEWVMPDQLEDQLGKMDQEIVENRPNIEKFLEKIKAIPADPRK